MDCAPCAHAIHVSMKGIQGVSTVDVDLNTGLVTIKLASGNNASMRQFNQAVEKNGFTHKDAEVIARGQLSGTAGAPFWKSPERRTVMLCLPATGTAISRRCSVKQCCWRGGPAIGKGQSFRHAALQVNHGGEMTTALPTQAPATCQTSGPAQLLLPLQFVQHSHLLRVAFRPGPAGIGDDGRLAAFGRSVAGQSVESQDLDVQHRRHADRNELRDDLSDRSSSRRERLAQRTIQQHAARSAKLAGSSSGDPRSSGHAASLSPIFSDRFWSE